MSYPGDEDPNTDWWRWVYSPDNTAMGIVSGYLTESGLSYFRFYNQHHNVCEKLGADMLRLGVEQDLPKTY